MKYANFSEEQRNAFLAALTTLAVKETSKNQDYYIESFSPDNIVLGDIKTLMTKDLLGWPSYWDERDFDEHDTPEEWAEQVWEDEGENIQMWMLDSSYQHLSAEALGSLQEGLGSFADVVDVCSFMTIASGLGYDLEYSGGNIYINKEEDNPDDMTDEEISEQQGDRWAEIMDYMNKAFHQYEERGIR